MKSMNPTSSRALLWFAGLVVLTGFLVNSPSGALLAFCLAAFSTFFPAVFGSGRTRLIAAVLLLLSIGLAASKYPDFKREQERYRQPGKTARAIATRGADNGGKARF